MAATGAQDRHVVLLRGINVGGHNKLPMADLRAALEAGGYTDVSTYIQSGNVALSAPTCDAAAISGLIEEAFGLTLPVVVRNAEQLRATIDANPFPEVVDQPKLLHACFCQDPISEAVAGELDHDRFLPDRMVAGDREMYVFYPNGAAGSKLTTAMLERVLGQRTTARNWTTVLKLLEMAEGSG